MIQRNHNLIKQLWNNQELIVQSNEGFLFLASLFIRMCNMGPVLLLGVFMAIYKKNVQLLLL